MQSEHSCGEVGLSTQHLQSVIQQLHLMPGVFSSASKSGDDSTSGARSLTPAHRVAAVDTRNGSRRAGVGEYDDTSHLTAPLKRQLFQIVVT